jgi:hypothetical protein
MSRTTIHTKDPDAVLDYAWDWSAWLAEDETITDKTVSVEPSGLTIDSSIISGGSVIAWLSGGDVDTDYAVTCHIETSNTPVREDDRTLTIQVRQR